MKKDQRQKKRQSPKEVLKKIKQLIQRSFPGTDKAGMPAQWALIPVNRQSKRFK